MAILFSQHEVKNFAEWKKVFDSKIEMRKSGGELSAQVYQDVSNPNKVTALSKFNSLENAQKFAQSPELRAAMEQAGVLGQPVIMFLNEA